MTLDARRAYPTQGQFDNLRWSVSCDQSILWETCRAKRGTFHRGDVELRLPWIKWYPANWSSEPGLRLCCAATRGIWAEALNVMMLYGSDRVQGSVSDLARVCACEASEMMTAIGQLSLNRVANVFQQNVNTLYVHNGNTMLEQNVNIIIVSRRRARELEIKKLRSDAGKISATKRQHAKEQEAQHRSSSSYSSSSFSVQKKRCTEEESVKFCLSQSLTEDDGKWFFDKCEGNGWKNSGKPIVDWQATIRSWKRVKTIFPSQKNGNGQKVLTFQKQKERAPIYDKMTEKREVSDKEMESQRKIARECSAQLRTELNR